MRPKTPAHRAGKPKRHSAREPRPRSGPPRPAAKTAFSAPALWVSLALIVSIVLVYAAVWHHDFVNYDDHEYILDNPFVPAGLSWRGVAWAFTTGYFCNWHPLTWLSHMLDVQVYALNPGPHHITSVLFHIANSILLFGLLRRMTGALGRSAFVAGLFAVHPLHVESVAWVAERKDVLSTLFWILTLWAYLGYVRRPRVGRYLLVCLLFALGLMSKPMLVTIPFVLLLLDFWPLGRLREQGPGTRGQAESANSEWQAANGASPLADRHSRLTALLVEKLPLLALAIASSIVTVVAQKQGGALIKLDALPWSSRVANALVSYVGYIGQMAWPTRLAAFYPFHRSLPLWWVAGAALGLIGVSVAAIRAARSRPYLLVGWLWYLGTLVPVIGLVQVGNQSMADRYTYVPLMGLFIIAAWGAVDLLGRRPYGSKALPIAAGLAILACGIAARRQVQFWKDSITLWEHTLQVTTDNPLAHYNLGVVLSGQGRAQEAILHYLEAVRIKPDYADAHDNLGLDLANQGNPAQGISHLLEAVRIKPDFALAHYNLGVVLESQGRVGEAIAHYSEAARFNSNFALAHYNLGFALANQGRVAEAAAHYSEALRINPNYAEVHNNLANILLDQGRAAEAAAHYSEALRINPNYPEAHNNLGNVLAAQGKAGEAIAQYSEALRINPNYAVAHGNLGNLLARQGMVGEAIHEFSEALRINPADPKAQRALAAWTSRGNTPLPGTR